MPETRRRPHASWQAFDDGPDHTSLAPDTNTGWTDAAEQVSDLNDYWGSFEDGGGEYMDISEGGGASLGTSSGLWAHVPTKLRAVIQFSDLLSRVRRRNRAAAAKAAVAATFRSRAASPTCVMVEAEAMGSAIDLESDANCNLCCTPADEFVFLACGHEMCRGCLQKHMTKRSAGRFCPSCFARDVITYEMHWVRGAKPTSAQVRAAALHACRLQPQFAAHSRRACGSAAHFRRRSS